MILSGQYLIFQVRIFYHKLTSLLIHLFKYVLGISYVLCSGQATEVTSPGPWVISNMDG